MQKGETSANVLFPSSKFNFVNDIIEAEYNWYELKDKTYC